MSYSGQYWNVFVKVILPVIAFTVVCFIWGMHFGLWWRVTEVREINHKMLYKGRQDGDMLRSNCYLHEQKGICTDGKLLTSSLVDSACEVLSRLCMAVFSLCGCSVILKVILTQQFTCIYSPCVRLQ